MVTNDCNNLGAAHADFAETIDIFGINHPVREPYLAGELHPKKPASMISVNPPPYNQDSTKEGWEWGKADRSTTGAASQLLATADRSEIRADGCDRCCITVTVADEKGRLVPRSMNSLDFKIDEDAETVSVCNGDATSHESLQGTSMPAFNGLCQVILRGNPGSQGKATHSMASDMLPTGKVTITTR